MTSLTAPFPYAGGKKRWAPVINERLGEVDVYVEPFAGSCAVLLSREPARREIIGDLDGMIVNFWRAVAHDPGAVAVWADWPTFHDDLTARHKWLIEWKRRNSARLTDDAEYYDAKAAGWWVWGCSLWIGGGFCSENPGRNPGSIQHFSTEPGGRGVSCQNQNVPNKRPIVSITGGGKGASIQRHGIPHVKPNNPTGQGIKRGGIPEVKVRMGGQGVNMQRTDGPTPTGTRGARLIPWMTALAERMERVIILRRSWQSAVTPTLLTHTDSGPKLSCGILLDPPYATKDRSKNIYDSEHQSDDAARESYEWAVEHGGTYRIAYCCSAGDWPIPEGWDAGEQDYTGVRDAKRRAERKEQVMFSPACRPKSQGGLF